MNNDELIELFKPCKSICMDCGAKCCYKPSGEKCKALENGVCTQRNWFCLMHYCDKIELAHPEIVKIIKQEANKRFPDCALMGVTPNFKWTKQTKY